MVREISLNIDASKANPVADIPTVMLKWTVDIHLLFITKIIDFSFENSCFQDELKLAEVSPIFKNKDDLHKENDRPVSILSHASKVLEKILYIQIATLMEESSQLYFRHKNLQLQNIQFSNTEINIEKKTATAVIKNELKYFPMSEGNACIAEPNLEALPLIWFSKGLV